MLVRARMRDRERNLIWTWWFNVCFGSSLSLSLSVTGWRAKNAREKTVAWPWNSMSASPCEGSWNNIWTGSFGRDCGHVVLTSDCSVQGVRDDWRECLRLHWVRQRAADWEQVPAPPYVSYAPGAPLGLLHRCYTTAAAASSNIFLGRADFSPHGACMEGPAGIQLGGHGGLHGLPAEERPRVFDNCRQP